MSTRLLVSVALFNGADITIDGDRATYLGKVLRARVGDSVTLFNGDGMEYGATITAIARRSVTLQVGDGIDPGTESALTVQLVQGVSRGERMDFVVQKATELGVARISPVLTEYGVVKLNAERAAKRQSHWQKIAQGAAEQCGRTRVPQVDVPQSLQDWFGGHVSDSDPGLILVPGADKSLASVATTNAPLRILIGPEGGFSQAEVENAALAGFQAVASGPRILRTETAAVAALSILQATMGDLR